MSLVLSLQKTPGILPWAVSLIVHVTVFGLMTLRSTESQRRVELAGRAGHVSIHVAASAPQEEAFARPVETQIQVRVKQDAPSSHRSSITPPPKPSLAVDVAALPTVPSPAGPSQRQNLTWETARSPSVSAIPKRQFAELIPDDVGAFAGAVAGIEDRSNEMPEPAQQPISRSQQFSPQVEHRARPQVHIPRSSNTVVASPVRSQFQDEAQPHGPLLTEYPKRSSVVAVGPPRQASVPAQPGIRNRIGPRFDYNTPPAYPPVAALYGQQGTVMLRLRIAADGRVVHVEIAQSSGYQILDSAAVAAVRRWRGIPAFVDGAPVESVEILPIRFQLD